MDARTLPVGAGVDHQAPRFTVTPISTDRKLTKDIYTRPVCATMGPQITCDPSCPWRPILNLQTGELEENRACYANNGHGMALQTKRINRLWSGRTASEAARAEARALDMAGAVPGADLRLHTVGDCRTAEDAAVVSAAAERYVARTGGRAWTYTHSWRHVDRGAWGTVSVLASCETLADVMRARARGYQAAWVVMPGATAAAAGRAMDLGGGIRALQCPEQSGKAQDCASCRLCMQGRADGPVIVFEAHGATRIATSRLLRVLQ